MASVCVNKIGVSPETSHDYPSPAYGWISSATKSKPDQFTDFSDFEFPLDDPATVIPADQLFSDGKLMPLHLTAPPSDPVNEAESVGVDPYMFSPKPPRCFDLGLRKLHQKAANGKLISIRKFLQRSSKSDVSLNAPLLKDSDSGSLSISSSRHSLDAAAISGTSSGPNQGVVRPRVKLEKPRMVAVEEEPNRKPLIGHPSAPESTSLSRAVAVDSPRLSSSGKIVFYGLERSSSSPSSLNGGARCKHRGVERSYSANARVTPVLNVPLCKSGVFGLFSFQKREGNHGSSRSSESGQCRRRRHQQHHHSTCGSGPSGRIRRRVETGE